MVENIEAAKELVKLYRSITKKQLTEVYKTLLKENKDNKYSKVDYDDVLSRITGFGGTSTCHLCKPINAQCHKCIHGQPYIEGESTICKCVEHETYKNIVGSRSINELYEAILDRADYIESLINKLEHDN